MRPVSAGGRVSPLAAPEATAERSPFATALGRTHGKRNRPKAEGRATKSEAAAEAPTALLGLLHRPEAAGLMGAGRRAALGGGAGQGHERVAGQGGPDSGGHTAATRRTAPEEPALTRHNTLARQGKTLRGTTDAPRGDSGAAKQGESGARKSSFQLGAGRDLAAARRGGGVTPTAAGDDTGATATDRSASPLAAARGRDEDTLVGSRSTASRLGAPARGVHVRSELNGADATAGRLTSAELLPGTGTAQADEANPETRRTGSATRRATHSSDSSAAEGLTTAREVVGDQLTARAEAMGRTTRLQPVSHTGHGPASLMTTTAAHEPNTPRTAEANAPRVDGVGNGDSSVSRAGSGAAHHTQTSGEGRPDSGDSSNDPGHDLNNQRGETQPGTVELAPRSAGAPEAAPPPPALNHEQVAALSGEIEALYVREGRLGRDLRVDLGELGSVRVQVQSEAGRLEVRLEASHPEALRALTDARQQLEARLSERGLGDCRVAVRPEGARSDAAPQGGGPGAHTSQGGSRDPSQDRQERSGQAALLESLRTHQHARPLAAQAFKPVADTLVGAWRGTA